MLLFCLVFQLVVYDYYGQRIAGQLAWLPGSVAVSMDARLSSRKAWDLWALIFVAMPVVMSVVMLGKHLIHAVR